MSEIVDVNFNFQMIDGLITRKLNEYNILKGNYWNNEENGEQVYAVGEQLIKILNGYLALVDFRLRFIETFLEKENKDNEELVKEKEHLKRMQGWYKKLLASKKREIEKYLSGDFGDELEL